MALSVAVAVIARHGAQVERCVAALDAAGVANLMIMRAGADGMAAARNRALAGCRADVLAIVEDDVAVEPGWFEAMTSAWRRGDDALGCAGGPLRAAFPGGRPPWLSDVLLGAYATMDLGDEPLVVDASRRTFHGGNVSFRAGALRGIGGFWPARGHPLARDWFSDEHRAQHDLARAGWALAYVPGAAAARLVTDESRSMLLRRRLRYGARLALLGERRPAAVAARRMLTGAAGSAPALVRGRHALAMERAARAAENAGVLLAGRLAGADPQPTARETPFRASVPMPPRPQGRGRLRARGPAGPIVLLYHRVAQVPSDPHGVCVSPEHLAEHLDVLQAMREIVPLADVAAGTAAPNSVAITFDDGYGDIAAWAVSALVAKKALATLFAVTGHSADNRSFWWDDLDRILRAAPSQAPATITLALAGQERIFRVATPQQRRVARRHLHDWLHPMPPEAIDDALAALRRWSGVPNEQEPADGYGPMTIAQIRAFAATPGLTVGAHSRTHRSLRYADPAAQEAEIMGSRDDLAAWLGNDPIAFSYPFGVPGTDFDAAVAARVRDAGFRYAVANAPGVVTPGASRFALPRCAVPDVDGPRFAAWLAERSQRRTSAP